MSERQIQHKTNMQNQFSFKIYTPIEGILFFSIGCVLGFKSLYLLEPYLHIRSWNDEFIKILFLVGIFLILLLIQKVITTRLTVFMDTNALYFQSSTSFLGFYRYEKTISWFEMEEWSFQEGHLSGHAWSPSIFKIKYAGRKKTFFIADGNENSANFRTFFDLFETETYKYNVKNKRLNE